LGVIVFFDASAIIYLVEGAEPFAGRARMELARLAKKHIHLGAAVSRLSWLECRVKPARDRHYDILSRYDAFFGRPNLSWVELTKDVVELAAQVRVRHRLRTPDALQASCCLQLSADHLFLTGDAAFRKVIALNVLVLR
jgi:predicted nucleic acid-binding protein